MYFRVIFTKLPHLVLRNSNYRSLSELGSFTNRFKFARSLHYRTFDKDLSRPGIHEVAGKKINPFRDNESVPDQTRFENTDNKNVGDPNVFGTLSSFDREEADELEEDSNENEEEGVEYRPPRSQQLTTKEYAKLIKEHLNKNQLKEAIDVLEVRMLKEDRVKPENYIYNLLISGCAKAGYSRKAFSLFTRMKQRDLKVTGGTYTSLFNACANAPWSQDGLNKAKKLRETMFLKGFTPNAVNYNAMIKAFGRCGDVVTAYELVDEMIDKKLPIRTETFNFLLQACASAKDYGFRHALLTWHKMYQRGVNPDIYSFKLLLRCVRDCSIGDLHSMEEAISQILESGQGRKTMVSETKTPLIEDLSNDHTDEQVAVKLQTDEENKQLSVVSTPAVNTPSPPIIDETPNLLSKTPHLGSLMAISEVTKPEERLLLLGGMSGFLDEMKKAKVTPNIEAFTTLLEVIPSTAAAEKRLLSMIRKIGLKADIDFFNVLIKKRSMRFDYEGAKEVLSMIRTAKLQPDIVTYGVLALGCQTQGQAQELLHEMRSKDIRMNIQILGAMLRQGTAQRSFAYVHEILQIVLEEGIKPNEQFLKHLNNFENQCAKLIEQRHPVTKSKTFKHNHQHFQKKLKAWYEEQGIADLTLEDAVKKLKGTVYQQFKEAKPQGFEEEKNEKLARKQKIRKYIKKIKLKDLKDDTSDVKSIGG